MTRYHAFSEIDPSTPAAIIELGFMGADRELLTENSYAVAQGVARGIACFLEGE
jgi:N-acetylmuramoyl-L-alanine amidase